jgi:hypothetical protein
VKKKVVKKKAPSKHSRPRRPSTTMLLPIKQRERRKRNKTKPSTGVVEMTGPSPTSSSSSTSKSGGLLTEKERKDKAAQEELEAIARKEKEERDKEPALGTLAGGKLKSGSISNNTYLSEVYEGVGPLQVPCTRGEQKALTGDTIVKLTIEKEDPEDDVEIIFIVPRECAEALLGSQQDLTNADYDSIVSEKSERAAHKAQLGKEPLRRELGRREVVTPVGSRASGSPARPIV